LMRRAVVSEPGMVSTLVEEGLAHLTMPHYKQGLAKFGVNVESFFDNKGHFKGEGGVEGVLRLTLAMKKAGLDNPFKLGQAGFREKETRNFWLEMMASLDAADTDKDPNLIKMLERGRQARESNQLAANLEEAKHSNYGKLQGLQIEQQKAQLGEGPAKGVDFTARMAEYASDHMGQVVGAGVSTLLLGRYMVNRWRGQGAEAGIAGGQGGVLGGLGLGVQRVFVTNWPGSAGVAGGVPGGGAAQGRRYDPYIGAPIEEPKQGKFSKALGAAGKALGMAGAAASGWELGYNVVGPVINAGINAIVSAVTGKENSLGGLIYDLLHREKEPVKVEPIKVEVSVKDGALVAAVNDENSRRAKRH
jgi:hypothetical protein